jgi:hypothetical protein
MSKTLRQIYGAGVVFFYYLKWPFVLGYPALLYGADYPRHWSMDAIWLYCVVLIIKDFLYMVALKKRHNSNSL